MPWDDRLRRRLKLRDLDILMAVIQAGSMGKAAGRFNMTQPAVSKLIAELEHMLGVRLLERSRQGVEPTPHGRALVKRGIAVFDELRQGVQDLDFLSDPTTGELRIGATEPLATAIVAPVIDRLSRQYPRITFHVATGDSAALYPQLAARSVELMISRITNPVSEEYSVDILFRDPSVVVTGANNPLCRRRKIALAELMNEPWALGPVDSFSGAVQAEVFRASGLPSPRLTVSTVSVNLRNELLATGRFLTVFPSFSLRLPRRHPSLRALRVDLPDTRIAIAIVTLKNRTLSPIVELFIDKVRDITRPLVRGR
ncbi:MAG TPA: LysR family transcriptional regulator [Xanthobacteraceae bacterium]|nr:LysR family transcriptional regulator [Xanthobacteraceae bacterium]